MQIVRYLCKGPDKVQKIAAELTQELGLTSGGTEEEMKDVDANEDDTERIAAGGMPNFNLDPGTLSHENLAYQEIASSSNSAAEQLLGLVHTETSVFQAKEALRSIPEGVEDEDEAYYEGK